MKVTVPFTLDAAMSHTDSTHGWDKLMGLTIVALVPAIFWTALLAFGASAFGYNFSATAMIALGTTLFGFLSIIYTAIASTGNNA